MVAADETTIQLRIASSPAAMVLKNASYLQSHAALQSNNVALGAVHLVRRNIIGTSQDSQHGLKRRKILLEIRISLHKTIAMHIFRVQSTL